MTTKLLYLATVAPLPRSVELRTFVWFVYERLSIEHFLGKLRRFTPFCDVFGHSKQRLDRIFWLMKIRSLICLTIAFSSTTCVRIFKTPVLSTVCVCVCAFLIWPNFLFKLALIFLLFDVRSASVCVCSLPSYPLLTRSPNSFQLYRKTFTNNLFSSSSPSILELAVLRRRLRLQAWCSDYSATPHPKTGCYIEKECVQR